MFFTIVTPCFNSAETIRGTFDSILAQTCLDYEYWVVDGGSSDGTLDIIREYEPKFSGRMHWISELDRGIYDAVKKGFARARGEVLCWIGSDDYYFPEAFETVKSIMEREKEVKWITGAQCHVVGKNNFCDPSQSKAWQYYHFVNRQAFWVQQEATFWRKDLWLQCQNAFENYKYAGDYALWLQFSKHTQLVVLPALLAAFRLRKNQVSRIKVKEYMREVSEICKKEEMTFSFLKRLLYRMLRWGKNKIILRRIAYLWETYFVKKSQGYSYDIEGECWKRG